MDLLYCNIAQLNAVNERNIIQAAIQGKWGPGRIRATPVTVANGRMIRIAAVGITSSREALANSSSLQLKWELSSCDHLAYWKDNHESKRSQSDWERFLVLQNETGLVGHEPLVAFLLKSVALVWVNYVSSLFSVLACKY